MFQTIEKLRGKPERTKKQIAFGGALLFAGIIFVIWLTVVYPSLKQEKNLGDKVNETKKSPVTSFKETFSAGVSGIGEQFKNIKEAISGFSVMPEYYTSTSSDSSQISTTTEVKN